MSHPRQASIAGNTIVIHAALREHSGVPGDFKFDGIISGDDYSVIDFNIAAQGRPL